MGANAMVKERAGSPPARSVARQKLAAAIERNDAAKRDVETNTRAQEQAHQAVRAARQALADARAAVEEAKENAARHITETLKGEAGDPPRSVKDARAAVQSAQDDLDAAESALTILAGQNADVAKELTYAGWNLKSAIEAVVHESGLIEKLIEKFKAMQLEVERQRRLIHSIGVDFGVERRFWDALPDFGGLPTPQEWPAALAALEADPDAPLPDVN